MDAGVPNGSWQPLGTDDEQVRRRTLAQHLLCTGKRARGSIPHLVGGEHRARGCRLGGPGRDHHIDPHARRCGGTLWSRTRDPTARGERVLTRRALVKGTARLAPAHRSRAITWTPGRWLLRGRRSRAALSVGVIGSRRMEKPASAAAGCSERARSDSRGVVQGRQGHNDPLRLPEAATVWFKIEQRLRKPRRTRHVNRGSFTVQCVAGAGARQGVLRGARPQAAGPGPLPALADGHRRGR